MKKTPCSRISFRASRHTLKVCLAAGLLSATTLLCAGNKITFGGRLFVDGGTFIASPETFHSNVCIPELRLTAKADFGDGWYTKLDVGFADNKAKLKDAFIQKTHRQHVFRLGYMIGMFSLDQSSSTNDYLFMTGSTVGELFYPGRRIGLSYTYAGQTLYGSAGLFCGDGLTVPEGTRPGTNATLRVVYRPIDNERTLLHLGAGGLYKRPDKNQETGQRSIALALRGCTYLAVPYLFDASLEDVKTQYQWNAEAILYHRRFFAQGEIMGMTVTRAGQPGYHACGGYLEGGCFVRGHRLGYDRTDAVPTCPGEAGSLAVFARVGYTDLNGSSLRFGSSMDLSAGVNYYLNPHLIFRLNYSHVRADRHTALGRTDYNVLQSRIQIKF